MGKEKILSELVRLRTGRPLDDIAKEDREYQKATEQQDIAFAKLEKVRWRRWQHRLIDGALSANNSCGAVYAALAYRHGLEDGVRLASELREIGL